MIGEFVLRDTVLTFFVLANWIATLATAAALAFIYMRQRYLFVRPSTLLLGAAHVLYQWPLAVYSGYYQTWLPSPWGIFWIVHGTIIVALIGVCLTWRSASRRCWQRIGSVGDARRPLFIAFGVLAVTAALMAGTYLLAMPITCTGLWALFVDAKNYPLAREVSLKLLADPIARYALTLLSSSVAPLLTATAAAVLLFVRGDTALKAGMIGFTVLTWLAADLNGSKSILVSLSLVVIAAIVWRDRLAIAPIKLAAMSALALCPAIVITASQTLLPQQSTPYPRYCYVAAAPGEEVLDEAAIQSLVRTVEQSVVESAESAPSLGLAKSSVGDMLYRAAIVPLSVGGWYVHHLQTRGAIGPDAIPRLARWRGREAINGPNVIGVVYGPLYYGRAVAPTISAGSGFIFSYPAYFGYGGIVLSIVGVWLLDAALGVLLWIARPLVVPLLAALSPTVFKLLEADYTAGWLSHGYGVILILAVMLSVVHNLTGQKG